MAPEFPYKYKAVHPFLHLPPKFDIINSPMRFLSIVLGVVVAPVTMIAVALFYFICGLFLSLVEKTVSDHETPFTGFRKAFANAVIVLQWRLIIHVQRMFLVRVDKKKFNKDAHVLISNHQNMDDVAIHGIFHQPVYLARDDMIDAYGIGKVLRASRSFLVNQKTSNTHLHEQMKQRSKNDIIQIFPEGTVTAQHCVIRFKPGAFKLDQLVQPVAITYHTALPSEWLCEKGFKHIYDLACNLFSITTYKYLDVIENETPDQAGKRLAEALGVEYLPYTSNDWLYFSGKSDDLSKCTKEYLQDFGWMGQQKDYQEMCKQKKKNPLYYWDKKTLGVE
ncbi:Lysophosphatidylcholine_acyltransferase/Lyso-PAF acetyltransferase [Hexamita inflata]|uniref:Lysophosphatidylcholine acyltransferase/Lyso-PAF acetyltransferase n=1 Tax=Hexamita inflata TaxID=28002 RepID=A0AA86QIC0_9EUKA|nr:Lysophosphatidylcholine acyltransferase/Lyso-PAF acetyltransferase [Hexamita inflata]CAI9962768.1 Lysophosphatidylcholine acyltransferase/Lyso-PAF acetyltransferase [Hexamita inflata]